jgi:hypothetical protein
LALPDAKTIRLCREQLTREGMQPGRHAFAAARGA